MVLSPRKNVDGSYNPPSLHIFWSCFIFFVPSFEKISQKVSKLLSEHYFQTEIFKKGHNSLKNVGRVMVLNLCISSYNLYICTKFHENISKDFNVFEQTWFPNWNFQKGNNSIKNVYGVIVLVPCTSPDSTLYFYQVTWKYLKRFGSYCADTISMVKFAMGHNSIKNVGGVMVLVLCMSNDHALWKYLNGFQSYWEDTISMVKFSKG